jgi:hypothetical protein
MEKTNLDELRDKVSCATVLEDAGFAVDLKESTRRDQVSSRRRNHHRRPRAQSVSPTAPVARSIQSPK